MIKRIVSMLLNLINPTIDGRLHNIEQRLENIEKELKRQRMLTFYVFIGGGGLALVGIGVSLHGQLPSTATQYIYIGSGLIVVAGLIAVAEILQRALRKNSDE